VGDDQVEVGQQQNADIAAQCKAARLKETNQQINITTFVMPLC
jgi:hypothetical protein